MTEEVTIVSKVRQAQRHLSKVFNLVKEVQAAHTPAHVYDSAGRVVTDVQEQFVFLQDALVGCINELVTIGQAEDIEEYNQAVMDKILPLPIELVPHIPGEALGIPFMPFDPDEYPSESEEDTDDDNTDSTGDVDPGVANVGDNIMVGAVDPNVFDKIGNGIKNAAEAVEDSVDTTGEMVGKFEENENPREAFEGPLGD